MKHASLFSGIGGAELAASWMGWEADFTDCKYKYWNWLFSNSDGALCANTPYISSYACVYSGSRICFSTSERAEQFGKQFIDLWNDFLLFR